MLDRRSPAPTPTYPDEFIGPRDSLVVVQMPFPGLYDSSLDAIIDSELESVSNNAIENGANAKSADSALWDATNFATLHYAIAAEYVDALNYAINEERGVNFGLRFESMHSPREYNFTTDRLFAYVPTRLINSLFKAARRSGTNIHKRMNAVCIERHTSYDGFFSSYSPDWQHEWPSDVAQWDHNQLASLFLALATPKQWESIEEIAFYTVQDGFNETFERHVDWGKYASLISA